MPALGGVTHGFGIPGVEEHAVGMKTLADAFSLRNRMIEILERADLEEDPDEKRAEPTFVIGGGELPRVDTVGEVEELHPARKEALLPEAAPDRCQRPPGRAARPDLPETCRDRWVTTRGGALSSAAMRC